MISVQPRQIQNPYINKIGYRNMSSDADKVLVTDNEFREAVRAHSNDLQLLYDSWDAYFALNNGQWERSKLQKLRERDSSLEPRTYDIISPKVDTLAGAIMSELPDMDWVPVEGERSTATEAIKDSWHTDKELTNSEYEIMLAIRDGLVHIGWIQMVETIKYGKPVIGFRRIMPGFFVPSAYWVQQSDREMKVGFKIGYMTPQDMESKYKAKSYEIDKEIEIIKKQGHQELPSNAYDMRRYYAGKIADHYKIIEKHYTEDIDTTRLIGAKIEVDQATGEPTGKIRWVPFPVTKDRATLEHYSAVNQIAWETVEETPYTDTIHKVLTVSPDFSRSIVLEDNKSKVQPQGLPFYHFTVTRFNGRNKGIVASLLDPQRTINERESLVTELISKANGGSELFDKNVFEGPNDVENYRKHANEPGYKHPVDLSQSRTGNPVIKVGSNQYPSQILDQIGRMWDQVIPSVSRVSDSMSAISQAGKSGILFEREIQVNRIGNLLMDKGVKHMMDGMAEGYFFQWQIAYAGIQREVTSRDGKMKTRLNERFVDSYGREMIRNAVGYVPRCRALVTESTRSPTYQMRYRMIYTEILQNINPEINPEHYNFVFTQFMHTLDLPEKDKAQLEALNRMLETKTKMQFVQQIMSIHAGTKMASLEAANADMQLNMIMQQLQAQGGAQQQAQPAVPEQITDATDDVQPAGPEAEPPTATGSDIAEGNI